MKNFGVENPSQNESIQLKTKPKIKKTHLTLFYKKLFGINRLKNLLIPLFSIEEYKGQIGEKRHLKYKFQCIKCGTIFESSLACGHMPRCHKCFPVNHFTKPHKAICEYLEKNNIKLEVEKFIKPYSVDIFIEPNKIIEIYGDYWHGNPKIYKENQIINYPFKKILTKEIWQKDKLREDCLKTNYELLIIWEYEINNDWDSVEKNINKFIKNTK